MFSPDTIVEHPAQVICKLLVLIDGVTDSFTGAAVVVETNTANDALGDIDCVVAMLTFFLFNFFGLTYILYMLLLQLSSIFHSLHAPTLLPY